jgi:hypothetical protein
MSRDNVYKPSKHSYHGSTAPLDPTRCKYDVWETGRGTGHHQCQRKPWKDGWCRQHHPESIAARERAKDATYKREVLDPIARREAAFQLVELVDRLLTEWWFVRHRKTLPPSELMADLKRTVAKAKD